MRVRNTSLARTFNFSLSSGFWSESSISWSTRARASPPCSTSAKTIEWVIRIRGVSVSGAAAIRRLKASSFHTTKPSGGFLRFTLRRFLGSSPAFARSFAFSISNSGAKETTTPSVSKPERPARPAIWWNSRLRRRRILWPSNLVSCVSTTV